MNGYVQLYGIISSADKLTNSKGWVYLLYYPIMKELDSMKRYIRTKPSMPYSMKLVDDFYFSFGLYDHQLPAISINEFQRLLINITTFIPSPLKEYVPLEPNLQVENSITNFHDGSPCFYSKNQAFRVIVDSTEYTINKNERNLITDYIFEEIVNNELIDFQLKDLFRVILCEYVRMAVITDQTLAPAQCCVNHILKARGKHLVVLQHQRNMILTDIFPLMYLDFSLSDIYYTWFSYEFLEENYKEYIPFVNTEIVQKGNIRMPQVSPKDLLRHIEMSTTCLLILNAVEEKYIEGTMNSPFRHANDIMKTISMLETFHYNVYVRKDPRSGIILKNVNYDDSITLKTAIKKYDFCICDRPGGAAIEVLEEKGYVFVCFDKIEFRETEAYTRLREKGNQLKKMNSKDMGILNCDIDLLLT